MALPIFTVIAPSATQANAPLTTDLAVDWTNNTDHVRQTVYDPAIHTPQVAHDHDGVNSAKIAGASGGVNLIILSEANLATPNSLVNPLSRFKMRPDCVMLMGLPGMKGGIIRRESGNELNRFDIAFRNTGEVDEVMFGCVALDATGDINAEDRLEAICFSDLAGFIKIGVYTGNGVSPQAITGIGFLSSIVFIWSETAPTVERGVGVRSTNMVGTRSIDSGIFSTTNGIDSLDADGFSVEGNSTYNENGKQYGFLCLKTGMNSNGERIDLNTYSGAGA